MLKCTGKCKKEYEDHNQLIMFHNPDTDEYKPICRTCLADTYKQGKQKKKSYDARKLFTCKGMGQI